MTLKKAIVNSDAPIISSYEDTIPSTRSVGTLVKILPNVGLEQPNANWVKLGRTAWRTWEEGLPGCPEVIAHCARTESYQYILG